MGNFTLHLKYIYSFPGGGSVKDCGVVVVEIVTPKEWGFQFSSEVSHMTVDHHNYCYLYYNDGLCFDLIQLMIHHFECFDRCQKELTLIT